MIDSAPDIVDTIRARFPILFIDEAQDNSEQQSAILHRLFRSGQSPVIRQRLGDPKGTDEREHRSVAHVPDTEREVHVPGIGWCAESSKGKKAGAVHRSAPSSEPRTTPRQLLCASA